MGVIKAVITGDIVNSSSIQGPDRTRLLALMRSTATRISESIPMEIDFFRGDSFQILTDAVSSCMKIAILFRANLRAHTPETSVSMWDARVAVGIGPTHYESSAVSTSDGEAFVLSGRGLDNMGKRRLVVSSPWKEVNDELSVSTSFADEIITSWSRAQAKISFISLISRETQKEIAIQIGKTPQNVNKTLIAAKEYLISGYLRRCEELLENKISLL